MTRDQTQFEWLTDIIQDVEESDMHNMVETHIFITQYPKKYDLRTMMLVSMLLIVIGANTCMLLVKVFTVTIYSCYTDD